MANDYKVNISVQFNAIMNDINNAIEQLKQKIQGLTNSGGQKNFFSGIASEADAIAQKLEKLRSTPITAGNVNKFQADLQEINASINAVRENLEKEPKVDFTAKIAKQEQDIANLESKRTDENSKQIDRQIRGHKLVISNYKKQQEQANQVTVDAKKAIDNLGAGYEQAEVEVRDFLEQQRQLDQTKLANTVETQVKRFVGFSAILRYTRKYIQDLVQTYKEFDQSLVAIAAVTGKSRDEMWANIGVYNKMAQSLGTTTSEVINASKLYYQQGLTTTSVLKLTEETVKLATIAELDSADATEYLTTAMNGFKLSAEESTRVTDVWANLAAKTASDVDELAIAISKVASLAENAGMEIETASAFLNQMIETTREAPENLGTALKTIIARFQELKTSEEELSDGVDANKVERALKSAGVALRDTSGQFRDFDEVILELSSKWDGLDRNTQRYIATIAAGSRQQSRFIALVSDYEGLLRNVEYAYDSLGSADAQMAVFQEGLEASTNRLKAAWEGLYTSWSESATVLSKLIDSLSSLVSTLADLGAGASAFLAVLLSLIGATLVHSLSLQLQTMATASNIKTMGGYLALAKGATLQNLKLAAANAILIGQYVLIAALILGVVYAIIKWINKDKEKLKQLEKDIQTNKQLAAQEKDRASNLKVLSQELTDAYKKNEDLTNVRQKIIDQFGEEIQGVKVLTASYHELIEALEAERKERNLKAAGSYAIAQQKEEEKFEIDRKTAATKAKTKVRDEVQYSKEVLGTNLGAFNAIETEYHPYVIFRGQLFSAKLNDDGSFLGYPGLEEAIEKAQKEAYQEVYNNFGNYTPKQNELKFEGASIAEYLNLGLKDNKNFDFGDTIALMLQNGLSAFDSEGNFIEKVGNRLTKLPEALGKILTDEDSIQKYNEIIKGTFEGLTESAIQSFIISLGGAGVDSILINELENQFQNVKDYYENNPALEETFGDLTFSAKAGIMDALVSATNEEDYQQIYDRLGRLYSELGSKITHSMAQAMADEDSMRNSFSAVYREIQSADEETAAQLQNSGIIDYFKFLREEIGFTASTFLEGDDSARAYFAVMQNIADLQKGDLDNETYLGTLEETARLLSELTGLSYEYVRGILEDASARNSATTSILDQNDAINELTHSAFLEAQQTTEAKKAELNAYAAAMDAVAEELEARAEALDANHKADNAEVKSNAEKSAAMEQNNIKLEDALNDMGAAAHKAWSEAIGDDNPTNYNRVEGEIRDYIKSIDDLNDKDALLEAASKARDKARLARQEALKLTLQEVTNKNKKSGSGTSKADNSTKNYIKSLKQLADALKKAAEEAEANAKAQISAILAVLEAQKNALEERNKELEKGRNAAEKAYSQELNVYLDILKKEKEAREKASEDNQNALELQAKAAEEAYKLQIQALQDQIDALDDTAEAEERIFKLQKARDEYNKAQNNRTRLVLTKGAGWIFKTEQQQIDSARKALNDAQREYQKSVLQDQIDQLQEQADKWSEIAEGIGKSAKEIRELNEAIEKFFNNTDNYADIDKFIAAINSQQATQEQVDYDNDENGSGLAAQIKQIEEAIDQVNRGFEEQLDAEEYERLYKELSEKLAKVNDYTATTAAYLGQVQEYLTDILSPMAHEYEINTQKIEEIASTVEIWKEMESNLGQTVDELLAAKLAFDKYTTMYEKLGVSAFQQDSSFYQEMQKKIDIVAQKLQEAANAQKKYETENSTYEAATTGFSTGGVVDFYGPADLHGTIAEPEVVFNARQASALFNWVKSLSGYGIPQINGMNPTPVSTVNNNSRSSNDIYINELNVNSTADSFDSLVVDIRRYSPMVNGI